MWDLLDKASHTDSAKGDSAHGLMLLLVLKNPTAMDANMMVSFFLTWPQHVI